MLVQSSAVYTVPRNELERTSILSGIFGSKVTTTLTDWVALCSQNALGSYCLRAAGWFAFKSAGRSPANPLHLGGYTSLWSTLVIFKFHLSVLLEAPYCTLLTAHFTLDCAPNTVNCTIHSNPLHCTLVWLHTAHLTAHLILLTAQFIVTPYIVPLCDYTLHTWLHTLYC